MLVASKVASFCQVLTVLLSWSKHVSEPEISRWSSSVITISITMFQKRLIIWQRTRHAIHIAHCTVYTVFSVLCTAQMYTSVYSVHCTVYIWYILNYTLHCREAGKEEMRGAIGRWETTVTLEDYLVDNGALLILLIRSSNTWDINGKL